MSQTDKYIDPHQIISEILTIIGYEGDKNTFATRFVGLILDQALLSSVDGLPDGEKDEVKEKMKSEKDRDAATAILTRYISVKTYVAAVEKTTLRLLNDYLSTVFPTLYLRQKIALQAYLARLG